MPGEPPQPQRQKVNVRQSDTPIRTAHPEDAARLTEIVRACFPSAPEWRSPATLVNRWWRSLLQDGRCKVLIAEQDGEVAGFVLYVESEADWVRIESVGPHSKPAKILAVLSHPRILRSRLAKRRRVAKIFAAHDQSDPQASVPDDITERWRDAEFFLGLIGVDPAFRGSGHGTRLLQACEQLALARNAAFVRIHMDPRNTQAQAVYARSGYTKSGHDAKSLIMVKTLP